MNTPDVFYRNALDNLYDGVCLVDRDRRILFWNQGAKRITGFSADEVMGSVRMDNLLSHAEGPDAPLGEGPGPVAATLADGMARQMDLYLRHKDGDWMPVSVRVSPIAAPDGTIIGAAQVFSDNSAKAAAVQKVRELEEMMLLDALTGVGNRRYVEMTVGARLDEIRRYDWAFGLLFIDVDQFKVVNDTYGHDAGDEVLKLLARALVNGLRPFDLVGRWGGEEFVGVILNIPNGALGSVADRCRTLVEQSRFPMGTDAVQVTISVGAALARSDDTVTRLVKRADQLMYRSKAVGGNRVTLEPAA